MNISASATQLSVNGAVACIDMNRNKSAMVSAREPVFRDFYFFWSKEGWRGSGEDISLMSVQVQGRSPLMLFTPAVQDIVSLRIHCGHHILRPIFLRHIYKRF